MNNVFFVDGLFVDGFVMPVDQLPSKNRFLGIPQYDQLNDWLKFHQGVNSGFDYGESLNEQELARLLINGKHSQAVDALIENLRLSLDFSHNASHYLDTKVLIDLNKKQLTEMMTNEDPYQVGVLAVTFADNLVDETYRQYADLRERVENRQLTDSEVLEFRARAQIQDELTSSEMTRTDYLDYLANSNIKLLIVGQDCEFLPNYLQKAVMEYAKGDLTYTSWPPPGGDGELFLAGIIKPEPPSGNPDLNRATMGNTDQTAGLDSTTNTQKNDELLDANGDSTFANFPSPYYPLRKFLGLENPPDDNLASNDFLLSGDLENDANGKIIMTNEDHTLMELPQCFQTESQSFDNLTLPFT